MQWESNHYYSLKEADPMCLQIVISLLKAYPLTKGCLDTLGIKLQEKLAFGFFNIGKDIITEGDSGRDIFLLCTGKMDVIVNNQVVVKMESPSLVGEKGIISENSKRAATIKITDKDEALVVKIPMGSFLRDFNDTSIRDDQFTQVEKIYQNLFQGIQERLFDYIYLQKSLWEETNSTLELLNTQMLAKSLDNQKDPGWEPEIWSIVQKHLKLKLGLIWPASAPLNIANLRIGVLRFLDKKFASLDVTKSHTIKQMEWRNFLLSVSERVLKSLPENKKLFPLPQLELFNPSIYRMRLIDLLRKLEKRFEKAKIEKMVPGHNDFFGVGDRSNEFNLINYLANFYKYFRTKNPRRIQAQIAQKIASIAAECENQFNQSAVKMQNFITDVKKRNIATKSEATEKQIDMSKINKLVLILQRGMEIYKDNAATFFSGEIGKIKFDPNKFPTFSTFQVTMRSQALRKQMHSSFLSVLKAFKFQKDILTNESLHSLFHICLIEKNDTILPNEIYANYWFTFSDQIKLKYENEILLDSNPGMEIGGEYWGLQKQKGEIETDSKVSLQAENTSLILILPIINLPWTSNQSPTNQILIEEYLPLMQWLFDKQIEQFVFLKEMRDQFVQQWLEMKKVLELSQKTNQFEQKALRLPREEGFQISAWLKDNLGLNIDQNEAMISNQLSKRIYNFVLRSTSSDKPDLSIEQCGNLAYTKWRNILFEIVGQISSLNKIVRALPNNPPVPAFDRLAKKLTPILSHILEDTWKKQNPILSGNPGLNILSILHPDKHNNSQDIIKLYQSIFEIVSEQSYQLLLEVKQQKTFLETMKDKYSQLDTTSASEVSKIDMIHGLVTRLVAQLKKAS
ncbi:MAG: cyclic nucleotide-binding domain-containing protein [Deltaproteobacteria bacterium]|nr:cyclic nucleotide-binding domain-containing protein [Deltaproteobacteria bacterium]